MTDRAHQTELETWKEIARHLGVSIREAQYWEKNDGMPVHRMPGKKSRVKAYTHELDTWKMQVSPTSPNDSTSGVSRLLAPTPLKSDASAAPSKVAKLNPSRRALLGTIAVASGSAVGLARLFHHGAMLTSAGLVGNTIFAWDEQGREIWKHPFRESLRDRRNINGMMRVARRQVQVVDLYGDGTREVLFAAGFERPSEGATWDELYCFSSLGKLLWRYRPEIAVTFGDTQFSGPWHLSDMIIAPGPKGVVIWLSLEHWNWRPGAVITLNPAGHSEVKFVNAGHIYALGRALSSGRNYIMAGGVNNEYAAAALAIFDENAVSSCSPQTHGSRFECISGPTGSPDRYFLFPPSELIPASGNPYNVVATIDLINQEFGVTTREVLGERAFTRYRFSRDLQPVDFAFDDGWAASHRNFQTEGKLDHNLRDCGQLSRPILVRRWAPKTKWTKLQVPMSKNLRPDAYDARLKRSPSQELA